MASFHGLEVHRLKHTSSCWETVAGWLKRCDEAFELASEGACPSVARACWSWTAT